MEKNGLTKERKTLLKLVAATYDKKEENELDKSFLSSLDWGEIAKESVFQAVCFTAFKNAEKYKDLIPEAEYKKWASSAFNNFQNNVNVVGVQYKLISLLEENGVDYLILKGLSSASYYDEPSYRSLGDVDFLVYTEKQDEIKELLLNSGYKKGIDEAEHHVIFRDGAVVLEMHHEISGIPSGKIGDKIREFTKSALDTKERIKIKSDFTDCEFYAPNKALQGAILLIHMQHHMTYEGLGLRHLLDWAYFVNRTVNESFWEEKLLPFFKDIGLYYYAKAITKTCSLYLSSALPKWCEDISDEVCEEIIQDVLSLGNFGYNNPEKSKSGIMVSDQGRDGLKESRLKYLIKAFHNLVKARYPVAVKCKILYPIFYVWEFIRYIFGTIFGKRTKVSKMMKESKKRKSLYKKLYVFETENVKSKGNKR